VKSPKVSIIIPCYNYGRFIRETISSVEKCDSSLYELIIVNDGSTDEYTQQVLKELEEEGYYIIHQPNSGVASARNTGIAASSGKYILPLDADDEIHSSYLPFAIDILEKNSGVGVVYGRAEFFGSMEGEWRLPKFDLDKLLISNIVYVSAVYRKDIWVECEGYDINRLIDNWEDWDFWISTAKRGWKFIQLDEVIFRYRIHDSSKISDYRNRFIPEKVESYIMGKHAEFYKERFSELYNEAEQLRHWKNRPMRGIVRLALTKLNLLQRRTVKE
jgi:glycosyltransferase involved in cell wall biosynthesis